MEALRRAWRDLWRYYYAPLLFVGIAATVALGVVLYRLLTA